MKEGSYVIKPKDLIRWLIHWVNTHLTHNRDDEGDFGIRVLIHIPIGLLIGIPLLGNNLRELFLKYERNEDAHTQDEAWKDIFGAIVGSVITLIVIIAILLWLYFL